MRQAGLAVPSRLVVYPVAKRPYENHAMPRNLLTVGLLLFLVAGCVRQPDGVEPVGNFELDRYLGKWYEIARLDHSFERGLQRVTAEYSLRDDGGVRVVNRGYRVEEDAWEEAEGKAYFVETPDQGFLKVSFFGPFYGSYIVFELDHEDYQYAFVAGPDKSYLWLLSRTPLISPELRQRFIDRAAQLGFDTQSLIFVSQAED
jgi:apolipoprotein D and lipocalin family protein